MDTQDLQILAKMVSAAPPWVIEIERTRQHGKAREYYNFRQAGRRHVYAYLETRLVNGLVRRQYLTLSADGEWLVPTQGARDLIAQLPATAREQLLAA